MRKLKDGIRSLVKIDFHGNVHKYFRGTGAHERAANEARILKVLEERGCPNVPRLLDYTPEENYIVTTNCGMPAPIITRRRSDKLFAEIREQYGVIHDDPEPRNITYDDKEGHFCVIDFELATLVEEAREAEDSAVTPAESPPSATSRQLPNITWCAVSANGSKSPINDDSWLSMSAELNRTEVLPANGTISLEDTDLLFGVSDGMGGGNAGDLASSIALEKMAETIPQSMRIVAQGHAPDYSDQLKKTIQSIHRDINLEAYKQEQSKSMGATLTLAWFTTEQLHLAHIGDSRLYRHRDGKTEQLSQDHTLLWKKWKRGEISEIQFRSHPRKNVLFQCIGAGYRTAKPYLHNHSYRKGDSFLICSDGVIDGLWEKHIHKAFLLHADQPEALAKHIMELALNNAGKDDTTLITLHAH